MRCVHPSMLLVAASLAAAPACPEEAALPDGRVTSLLFGAQPQRTAAIADTPANDRGPNPAQLRRRNWAILGGGALAVGLYGAANWWNKGFSSEFRVIDEGWFGRNTGDGGADKIGHLYATYVGTRLGARLFEWVGNEPDAALRLGAWSTLGIFTAVEVLDAFTPRWRFSREDAIMNALGVGLGLAMEKAPALDRLIDFRLHYLPSNDPTKDFNFDPFGDYSGQTWLLAFKATGVPALADHPVLRYFELAVGYGTRGFEVGPEFPGDKSRNFYFGVSINLAAVLDGTLFRGAERDGLARRFTRGFLEVVQVPGTVALAKHRF